eukprot:scaffold7896_cov36-Prasinocladus_malaysianus.AAC.2
MGAFAAGFYDVCCGRGCLPPPAGSAAGAADAAHSRGAVQVADPLPVSGLGARSAVPQTLAPCSDDRPARRGR